MSSGSLVVSEIFGPTIQGEGVYAGRIVGFLRLGACNLSCSWCDTPYTWDASRFDLRNEMARVEVDEIMEAILKLEVRHLVISGGEPLLQQRGVGWNNLLEQLMSNGISVHIETNGTIAPSETTIGGVLHFTVSPKLAHSGDSLEKRMNPAAIFAFSNLSEFGQAIFKFVAKEESDLDEIAAWVYEYSIPQDAVWVMPEGMTRDDQLNTLIKIADKVIERRWNLTSRLHTLIWDLKRGV